ncbi:unnamed protein product [Cyprideis torosa]|uniref:RPA-interacting protein N-terminal domain-containing protein n=1 Tax=Cyprideis torosa TaxID=163714 RepID=A0A7R8W8V9_9CRUS|nr:unnamed protein product [Cyprideis torosa]CAG0889052.1 unnamed protein product [Cyprideis torosa]
MTDCTYVFVMSQPSSPSPLSSVQNVIRSRSPLSARARVSPSAALSPMNKAEERLNQFKARTTPPQWREEYKKKCLERLRESRDKMFQLLRSRSDVSPAEPKTEVSPSLPAHRRCSSEQSPRSSRGTRFSLAYRARNEMRSVMEKIGYPTPGSGFFGRTLQWEVAPEDLEFFESLQRDIEQELTFLEEIEVFEEHSLPVPPPIGPSDYCELCGRDFDEKQGESSDVCSSCLCEIETQEMLATEDVEMEEGGG